MYGTKLLNYDRVKSWAVLLLAMERPVCVLRTYQEGKKFFLIYIYISKCIKTRSCSGFIAYARTRARAGARTERDAGPPMACKPALSCHLHARAHTNAENNTCLYVYVL